VIGDLRERQESIDAHAATSRASCSAWP
jgi:hypothetical protein